MTDDHELASLNPFDLLDREAERLDRHFRGLREAAWARPSACEGWTTRDVLGHLAASEEYHRACLDGTVSELLARWETRGATDLDSANAMGVADYASSSHEEVLGRWRAANAENRRLFRERGDGTVDTSVGAYPCRWQAFHVAAELATHADDIGVPETDEERADREAWRAGFSRFALAESKPQLDISVADGRTIVSDGTVTADLDDPELTAAVMGRLDDSSRLGRDARVLLSTMP